MVRLFAFLLTSVALLEGQTALRDAAAQRVLLMGAAADSSEFGGTDKLLEAAYAATLGTQFNMLEPENAMKWNPIHPTQNTYNWTAPDELVSFAQAHNMKVRGHNLCWYQYNPDWVNTFAQTATPKDMSDVFQSHINTVVTHYKGKVFAWDVVNEAFSDSSPNGLRDSIWYNKPGIGLSGTGYIEQAFRWAHEADPDALLFYNDYSIEAPNSKFQAVYNMVKDFVSRGVPIDGVGFQMHLTGGSSYPDSAGLAQNIQQITALGLQVHITEMDVRLPVDSNGVASDANLAVQAQTYQRIVTVCLQNPGCTALQTWGFTDKYSWIPGSFPGFGAGLPFDTNYQAKPAVNAMITAMTTTPPTLASANIVSAASYQGGSVAPGELVAVFGADYGPATIVGAQLDSNYVFSSNLAGTQVLFDGIAAPLVYSEAGVVAAIVPFEVAGKQQTSVQYVFNNVPSNSVSVPVTQALPGIFAADSTGKGQGSIFNEDYSANSASNPAAARSVIGVYATGGGTVVGGAMDGAVVTSGGTLTLPVEATVGGVAADVQYHGPAPYEVSGVIQVNIVVPEGLAAGPQTLVIKVGGVSSQGGITVAVK